MICHLCPFKPRAVAAPSVHAPSLMGKLLSVVSTPRHWPHAVLGLSTNLQIQDMSVHVESCDAVGRRHVGRRSELQAPIRSVLQGRKRHGNLIAQRECKVVCTDSSPCALDQRSCEPHGTVPPRLGRLGAVVRLKCRPHHAEAAHGVHGQADAEGCWEGGACSRMAHIAVVVTRRMRAMPGGEAGSDR
jgi:hypothetical protein